MKIRNGFVSNSSSSSFLIPTENISEDMIRGLIIKLVEIENLVNKSNLTIDDICTVYTNNDASYIFVNRMETAQKYNLLDTYTEASACYNKYKNKSCIVVDSTGDNSIPWSIQDYLENLGERFHWS